MSRKKLEHVIHVRVSTETYNKIINICNELGLTICSFVRLAIKYFIREKNTLDKIIQLIGELSWKEEEKS